MNEEWKTIKGFEAYAVSDEGRVQRIIGGKGCVAGRILKPAFATHGYLQVSLCRDGVKYNRRVHVLVAEAFVLNPSHLPELNHADGVKTNCAASNLEWSTHAENIQHAIATGLIDASNNICLAKRKKTKEI